MAEVPDLSSLSPDLFFQSPDLFFQSPDLWEMSPYLCEVCLARRKKTAFSSQTVQVNDTFFADSFVRQYLCLAIPPKWSRTCLPATILPTNHNIYHEKVSYPALAHTVAPSQGQLQPPCLSYPTVTTGTLTPGAGKPKGFHRQTHHPCTHRKDCEGTLGLAV